MTAAATGADEEEVEANGEAREGDEKEAAPTTIGTATIDCSAANEYVRAHCDRTTGPSFDEDRAVRTMCDGRALRSRRRGARETLDEAGFAMSDSPLEEAIDWTDLEDVSLRCVPELERMLNEIFPRSSILFRRFWNPMARGEDFDCEREGGGRTPTSGVAPMAHIDTDVGAYERVDDLLDLVRKNELTSPNRTLDENAFGWEDVADAIVRDGKRFAILNFWRNVGDVPAERMPLAILATKYDGEGRAFPDVRPDVGKSRWFAFPAARKDEAIAFYQYDRDARQPSDLYHCAVSLHDDPLSVATEDVPPGSPRRSFDVRAFVVLDEAVPANFDRYGSERTRPKLTLEESGCFCDEQAAERRSGG
ncbi:hypothetical protein ACHAWF_009673 [Thalassiosira exigua]